MSILEQTMADKYTAEGGSDQEKKGRKADMQ